MNSEDLLLRARCTRFLSLHGVTDPRTILRDLADHRSAEAFADYYGVGGAAEVLETRVAGLLGKASAQFFLKGMVAQLSLLRVLTERRSGGVAIAALSHMAIDETDAPVHLIDAPIIKLGGSRPFTLAEVERLDDRLAVCVVELPLRRAAYRLPAFADLEALSRWCRGNGVHLHFDGARLWEAAAGYDVSPAALAALADSVYVSLYKGLGGLAGAVIAGDDRLRENLRDWKSRFGGNLMTAFPYVLSGLDGLDRRLPKMRGYVERARTLAARLRQRGMAINPTPPDVNGFQVILPGDPERLMAASRAFAYRHHIWLFNGFTAADQAGYAIAEIVIGDAAEDHSDDEIGDWVEQMLATVPKA